ncbi:hypothetical protein T05_6579 [Trichinella murrelli]|uniref:Uncharacterized protein n=1 Tax=Trichinella murrelli TaxID=144512 RepID=A0A0V0TZC3_9BILA|nr:hypothetical protein T05_6579 [Trichinella murrelli]
MNKANYFYSNHSRSKHRSSVRVKTFFNLLMVVGIRYIVGLLGCDTPHFKKTPVKSWKLSLVNFVKQIRDFRHNITRYTQHDANATKLKNDDF